MKATSNAVKIRVFDFDRLEDGLVGRVSVTMESRRILAQRGITQGRMGRVGRVGEAREQA
jgi:hypothetical protein